VLSRKIFAKRALVEPAVMRAAAIAANGNIRGHSIMASLLLPLPSIVNELPADCY
jgi:hypothetical protein